MGAALWLVLSVPMAFAGSAGAMSPGAFDSDGVAEVAADPINSCGRPVPRDRDSSRWGRYFEVNGVNIRFRPTTNSRVCGQGQKGHRVDYHCYKEGQGGTWTFVRDVNTRRAGWVKDTLLEGYGSYVHC
jgi:hypothetical protein